MAIYRLTVNMQMENQVVQNAWHVTTPQDLVTDGQLQDFVDGVLEPQRTNTSVHVSYESVEFRRVDISGTAGSLYVPTGWPAIGNQGGAALPSFCAMLISGVASGQSRPNRIRKFVCGIAETHTSESTFSSTGDTIRQALSDAWQTYIDGVHDLEIVAVSYKDFATGIIEDNVGGRWNLITSVTSHDVIAIMGSRKVGRGI